MTNARRMTFGVAGGFAGTLALLALRTGSAWLWPRTMPPLREDPGAFVARKVLTGIAPTSEPPHILHAALARSVALGYGLAAGSVYAAVRRRPPSVVTDGVVLGIATWGAGYLGWLPGLKLMDPIWEQRREQVIGPIVRHALFGYVTVAVYDRPVRCEE